MAVEVAEAQPKYVIFLIGDGMGFEQVRAGGMYANGAAGTLSFEMFPFSGELTNHTASGGIPDSAAAGTALATGVKVDNGVVSMAIPGDGSELETLLEYSKAQGKSAGLVTTTFWFDATPAVFGAHEPSRGNYGEIASDYWQQTRPNVVLGGYHDSDMEAGAVSAGYTVVTGRADMQALDTETENMVFGQFGDSYMPYEYDGLGALPHLSEMTATALSILDNDPDGFFLMVEGARIDHACHDNDIQRAVLETVEFNNAVQVAIDWAQGRTDTLILVTADHETGGLTVLANNGVGALPTVSWSSLSHTGVNVPVYAWGVNAEFISGVMDNTEMFGVVTAGPQAWNPHPQDGDTGVWLPPVLSWKPGIYAASHQVYFGTMFDDVNSAAGASLQADATYVPAGPLDVSTTYYWRVDEVNDLHPDSPWAGSVWNFTTAPGNSTRPDPTNGAFAVAIDTTLGWLPGPAAATHNVYFGTSSPPAFIGNQLANSYDPGSLEFDTTYYWRIDEVEADGTTVYTGDVWSFTTTPDIRITDPNLVGWWPLDEGNGNAALDWSGHGNHGTLFGPEWATPGFHGDAALNFIGGGYVAIQNLNYNSTGNAEVTVCAWIRTNSGGDQFIVSFDRNEYWRLAINTQVATEGQVAWHVMTEPYPLDYSSVTRVDDGLWHHVCGVFDNGRSTIYIDGLAEPSATGGLTFGTGNVRYGFIGANSEATSFNGNRSIGAPVAGNMDDVRIYDKALTPAEIQAIAARAEAWSPSPADGATEVVRRPTLSWTPGATAASHDVYLSTDRQAVIDGTAFIVNQIETSYSPEVLTNAATYYWRVDAVEANGTTKHIGAVWSFTVTRFGR
jgi:alkaline phosphatase